MLPILVFSCFKKLIKCAKCIVITPILTLSYVPVPATSILYSVGSPFPTVTSLCFALWPLSLAGSIYIPLSIRGWRLTVSRQLKTLTPPLPASTRGQQFSGSGRDPSAPPQP